jgi:hypothetical protein
MEHCILGTSSLDNGMATVPTNSLTVQSISGNGGQENTMAWVNVNGLTADITVENGKTDVPTVMEKKPDPTEPFAMMVNGRMIARYETRNNEIVNCFITV